MNKSQPYIVDMPVSADSSADDLWRIEFRTNQLLHWINNVEESMAQYVYSWWQSGDTGRLICCRLCPQTTNSDCPHSELPEQRGWLSTEMAYLRIMPMREAV